MKIKELPYMLYADECGKIYDHPYFRMAGFSGNTLGAISKDDLIKMPSFSKLFYFPGCAPIGVDPETGVPEVVQEIRV
ncbi:MAG: radical SAM protein, partial [Deltaproteobacteria bacterium]|nr:radical SAM protein [Deltaproteobacteria bacterium]